MRIKSIFSVFIILSCIFVFFAYKSSSQKQAVSFWKCGADDQKILVEIGENFFSVMYGPKQKVKFEIVGNELQGLVDIQGLGAAKPINLTNSTDTDAHIGISVSMNGLTGDFKEITKEEAQNFIKQLQTENALAKKDEYEYLKHVGKLLPADVR